MAKPRSKEYEVYKQNKTREKNKIRKLKKYLKKHPNNQVAINRLQELEQSVAQR